MNANTDPWRKACRTALPIGTPVLNTDDGERGTIVGGYATDPETGEFAVYEVKTDYGMELWNRKDFVLWREIEAALCQDEKEG